jgi:tripartite-type tricarboxylate transporter receptor subunit TctC
MTKLAPATLLALLLPLAASAADPSLFGGKDVTLIISSDAGGGTDITARMIGSAMRKHLPGQPNIIFRNTPGAGGVAALNSFYFQTAPDGLTFYVGAGNQFHPVTLARPEIKYQPERLQIIGGIANASEYLIVRKDAQARLTDRSAPPVQMAVFDGTHAGDQMAVWGAEAFGWNLKMVFGYQGTPAMMLALERGEADMMTNPDIDIIKPAIDRGLAVPVAQVGMLNHGRFEPSRLFPDIPAFASLGPEQKLQGKALASFQVWANYSQIGKWFALPPGTPERFLAAYREAFHAAANDPEFVQAFAKRISPDLKEQSADDVTGFIAAMVEGAKSDSLSLLSDLMKKYRN